MFRRIVWQNFIGVRKKSYLQSGSIILPASNRQETISEQSVFWVWMEAIATKQGHYIRIAWRY
jgi:hypothetical protein